MQSDSITQKDQLYELVGDSLAPKYVSPDGKVDHENLSRETNRIIASMESWSDARVLEGRIEELQWMQKRIDIGNGVRGLLKDRVQTIEVVQATNKDRDE